jgi:Uncharacterized protein conserved in archaea (DUF2226)
MDLPITRPSMMCYADELVMADLLNDLSLKKHNGFIRITSGDEEGFILFKEGKEIAASYLRYSRVDAIEKIKAAMEDETTLIEIFNVRSNQIDFYMDMNKPYIIGSEAYILIDELKKPIEINEPEPVPMPKAVPKPKPVSEALKESEHISKTITDTDKQNPLSKHEDDPVSNPPKLSNDIKTSSEENKVVPNHDHASETETKHDKEVPKIQSQEPLVEKNPVDEPVPEKASENVNKEPELKEYKVKVSSTEKKVPGEINSTPKSPENDTETKENTEAPLDRSELMKKYGIKDIQEEDVSNILESYKGGSVSDEDVEKIELTLMNKIKKSLLGIPKIRGAEVMVFLDNNNGLTGKVNIMIESETKGFLSKIMRDSNDDNLERQIVDISQIEIRKSFRKYPEIVDKFNVNVEIS